MHLIKSLYEQQYVQVNNFEFNIRSTDPWAQLQAKLGLANDYRIDEKFFKEKRFSLYMYLIWTQFQISEKKQSRRIENRIFYRHYRVEKFDPN